MSQERSSSPATLLKEVNDTLEKALLLPESRQLRELILPVEKHLRGQIRRRFAYFIFKLTVLVATLLAISLHTPLYYHFRAIGRIGLIQVTLITSSYLSFNAGELTSI